jgi:hypothetical protein
MSRMTTAALAAVALIGASAMAGKGHVELAPRGRGFQSNRKGPGHHAGWHKKKARNRKGRSR